jgi:phosphoribosylformylglycinamidine synthase subunit PurL
MNRVEKALIHALFCHLHHNIDKAIDFKAFGELNRLVVKRLAGVNLWIGPEDNDDAAVFSLPGSREMIVVKMESHCSPCVPRPYDAAATGAGGAMRDVVAMGGRPMILLDFIGTRPLEQEVIVGPCGFKGECTCGNCKTVKSQDRVDIMAKGIRDMCQAMGVLVVGGGFSTSFSDIVPAVVVTIIGPLIAKEPITKPAKKVGDRIIIIGETGNDGNDTLFRAGLVEEMRPAEAVFKQEKDTMDASLAIMVQAQVNACSDLGAAGIGAAVCESVRYGSKKFNKNLGAIINLEKVPQKSGLILGSEEILICETQARMLFQVPKEMVRRVLNIAESYNVSAAVIGEIVGGNKTVFYYGDQLVAQIPNNPSEEILNELKGEA